MGQMILATLVLTSAMAGSGLVIAECPDNPNGVRACGRKLADLRFMVCVQQQEKRGRRLFQGSHSKYDVDNRNEMDMDVWLQNLDAVPSSDSNEILPWHQHKRMPGIVSECCYNCCSLDKLREFC